MIIVDANSVAHQSKHAMKNLSWNEKQTGVIFGFLQQILILARTFGSNEFVFVWDSKESLRRKIFPDYKKARRIEKTPDEQKLDAIAYEQFDEIRLHTLPDIGFLNSFMIDGFEGDDVIASIIHNNKTDFVIVSADEDLYQLLSENVYLYSTKKKMSYTHLNLWKDYRITPKEWAEVKAIGGCHSDGVPGVPGVAELTASKYLTRKLNATSKAFKAIRENKELINFNMKLVKLPLEGTPVIKVTDINDLSLQRFQSVCSYHGFTSFLQPDRLKQWKEHVFKE
jgi:DNA polymerase-1